MLQNMGLHCHNDCMRRILGVRLADLRTLEDICAACGSESLELRLIRRKFQLLRRHVMQDAALLLLLPAAARIQLIGTQPWCVRNCVPESGQRDMAQASGNF